MTSQTTFLFLVSLLAPSWQQGQQYYLGSNQQQRFLNNYQQPQYFRTPAPTSLSRTDYAHQDQYEPDLKTSDISPQYQQQLSQFHIRRQLQQNLGKGFVPIQESVPLQKPLPLYGQTFDPFTSQNYQQQVRQPVSIRPETYLEHFGVQPPLRSNNFQVNSVNSPVPLPKQNQPKQVYANAKFNPNGRQSGDSSAALNYHVVPSAEGADDKPVNVNQNNVRNADFRGSDDARAHFGLRRNRINPSQPNSQTSLERTNLNSGHVQKENHPTAHAENSHLYRNRFIIRNSHNKVPGEVEDHLQKSRTITTEKPHTTTIKLRVPFEDEISNLHGTPIPISHHILPSTHAMTNRDNTAEEAEEEEEDEEQGEAGEGEEELEDYSEEYEDQEPEVETHHSALHSDNNQSVNTSKDDPSNVEYEYTLEEDGTPDEGEEEDEEEEEEEDEEEEEEEEENFSNDDTSSDVEEEKNDISLKTETATQTSNDGKQVPTPRNESVKNTTESWVIVASVQTSRSVSGARFLPSGVVNQKERNETLSEDGQRHNASRSKMQTTIKSTQSTTTSTESIIDKLDRVQSELSSDILSGDFKHFSEDPILKAMPMPDKPLDLPEVRTSSRKPELSTSGAAISTTVTTAAPSSTSTEDDSDDTSPLLIRRFSPSSKRSSTTAKPKKKLTSLIESLQFDDLSGLLPPGFKPRTYSFRKSTTTTSTTSTPKPAGEKTTESLTTKMVTESSASRRYSFKPHAKSIIPRPSTSAAPVTKIKFQEDISAFLPPDYKAKTGDSTPKGKGIDDLLSKIKFEEPTLLLPKNYTQVTTVRSEIAKVDNATASKPLDIESLFGKAKQVDVNAFLPTGFKAVTATQASATATTAHSISLSTTGGGVVFPSRPGGFSRKPFGHLTTAKPVASLLPEIPKIQKGWPVRATTAFSGWPTPSTTPISVERLLELAKAATSSSSSAATTTTTTTTTTSTTTTTPKPTTPGVCSEHCELAGTIKIVDGVDWIPEYLDRNTREWQELANEVENQLDYIYRNSESLSRWYKKVRIDSFSKGSVLVDYFVELSETGRQINTQEMKRLFHNSLNEVDEEEEERVLHSEKMVVEEGRANESDDRRIPERKFRLGKFAVDPKFTDFVVVPRHMYPTVGYAEEENFLPQWAIAVIVIGLASLLFVIIFGVTVLVNRHKNNKKKTPTPLTEDIINEMNKHHMGGFDNYGADDLYGMDDVWNDKGYEKPQKKRSHGSYADNSMTNLYDSWRSDWNGYYYNSYYGNGSGGSSGYGGRRRSDYDTNF